MPPPDAPPDDLLSLVSPHVKTIALLALVSGPLGIFTSALSGLSSLAASPAVLVAACLVGGGFLQSGARPSVRAGEQTAAGDGTAPDAGTDQFRRYLKFGLIGYIIFQICQPYGNIEFPLPPNVPLWAVWAISATVAAIALLAPTTKLYGPLRFACLECFRAIFSTQAASDWWLYPVMLWAFGPTLLSEVAVRIGSAGGLGTAIAAGAYGYHAYDKQLRSVSDDVARHLSVANASLASAREYAAVAGRYDSHLLSKGRMRQGRSGLSTARGDEKGSAGGSSSNSDQLDAIFSAALAAEETAQFAEQAISTARSGDAAGARQHAAEAKASAKKTSRFMEVVRQDMTEAQDLVRSTLTK
ncbi:hypothetical protein SPI_06375 [Niveomyces insectorum RCEF 264]|uniref:Uncharacterized protein n=1 Tax=Niveomyces insectorum RCEF 264 TaxID=1081102 RepID=A0A167S2T3_9HYPO|nr:hypothetical protein SPI_06375 [Niveomyces insectorum RCEF 264]